MNFYEHFYIYAKDLLCREEEADAILKTVQAINSLNLSKHSEAEMVMFIEDQFAGLLYGTGHEYNFPGYNAIHQLLNSLQNLDLRLKNYHLQVSMQNTHSAESSGIST
jgi:hypothetical protein